MNKQHQQQTKLSEDDEPSLVIGTLFNRVQQRTKRFPQMQMKYDKLPQLG
jgi:hypothetical protein